MPKRAPFVFQSTKVSFRHFDELGSLHSSRRTLMLSETKYSIRPPSSFQVSSPHVLVRPHPVVVSRLRHLPVTRTQLSHHDITMRPQRPAPIQFFAPEL